MTEQCELCRRIQGIKDGTNPYFVAELQTGYVVLGDHQLFRGYSLLLFKDHEDALHRLDDEMRTTFLEEMSLLGKAVNSAFAPLKLNYELLGNSIDHLHWHIFPRHADDPRPVGPVWVVDKTVRYAESARPTPHELNVLKRQLLHELERFAAQRILRSFRETKDVD